MKCKNPHCQNHKFCAIVEPDSNSIVGLKCLNCGARYLLSEVEIKDKLDFNRKGGWNSAVWGLRMLGD